MASFTRVSVDEMKFTPAHVEIVRGTSVRWEQSPKCVVRHCLEVVDPEENNQASSPALLPGEPWEHTFEVCGDFHYRSLVYCFMKGTVKVVDAPPADVDADRADAPVKTRAIAVDANRGARVRGGVFVVARRDARSGAALRRRKRRRRRIRRIRAAENRVSHRERPETRTRDDRARSRSSLARVRPVRACFRLVDQS